MWGAKTFCCTLCPVSALQAQILPGGSSFYGYFDDFRLVLAGGSSMLWFYRVTNANDFRLLNVVFRLLHIYATAIASTNVAFWFLFQLWHTGVHGCANSIWYEVSGRNGLCASWSCNEVLFSFLFSAHGPYNFSPFSTQYFSHISPLLFSSSQWAKCILKNTV